MQLLRWTAKLSYINRISNPTRGKQSVKLQTSKGYSELKPYKHDSLKFMCRQQIPRVPTEAWWKQSAYATGLKPNKFYVWKNKSCARYQKVCVHNAQHVNET